MLQDVNRSTPVKSVQDTQDCVEMEDQARFDTMSNWFQALITRMEEVAPADEVATKGKLRR